MKKLFIIILLISLTSCAVIVAPSGGPKDTNPPSIISFYPNNYATNFNDDYLSIQFDKYMNKSSVIQSLSISPEIKFSHSWWGKTLTISFDEELQDNITYVVKLNTGYTDFKGNKPESALTFIFTKGNKIDKASISGKLYDSNPAGKQIFAWRDKDIPFDITTKPDYSVSLGSSGEFELIGLKKGLYRVIATEDKFKDGLYNTGIDGFGAAQYDLEVLDSSKTQIKLKISPAFDRVGAGITNAYPLYSDLIQVNLTEPVYSDSLLLDNFKLEGGGAKLLNVFSNDFPLTKKIYLLTSPLDSNTIYNLNITEIKDTLGNLQIDSLSQASFSGVNRKYTKKIELLNKKIDSEISQKQLYLDFNHPISNLLDSAICIFNPKDSSTIVPEYIINSNRINLDFSKLQAEIRYKLSVNLAKINDFKNEFGIDSTLSFDFKLIENKGKSKISGSVLDSTNYNGKILVLLKKSNELIASTFLSNGKFEFLNLPEADYNLEIVCDENENGKYDTGNDFPFSFSEVFYLYDKSLKVKENWDIEDINIILK